MLYNRKVRKIKPHLFSVRLLNLFINKITSESNFRYRYPYVTLEAAIVEGKKWKKLTLQDTEEEEQKHGDLRLPHNALGLSKNNKIVHKLPTVHSVEATTLARLRWVDRLSTSNNPL